jgi:hypothetical protein
MDALRSARAVAGRRSVRALLLVAGLALFVWLAVRAFSSLPDFDGLSWGHLVLLALVMSPAMQFLNAAEFRLIASTAGSNFGWRDALNVTVVASLANLLPLPGAVAVRATALMRRGASLRAAGEANVLAALLWASASALLGGVAVAAAGTGVVVSLVIAAAGLVGLVVVSLRVQRLAGWPVAQRLVAIESATVVMSAARLYVAVRVLRQLANVGESIVWSLGQVLAALIGFVPGGLGLRELLAGGLASVIDSDSDVAIAATVVDRGAGQVGTLVFLALLVLVPGGPGLGVLRQVRSRR